MNMKLLYPGMDTNSPPSVAGEVPSSSKSAAELATVGADTIGFENAVQRDAVAVKAPAMGVNALNFTAASKPLGAEAASELQLPSGPLEQHGSAAASASVVERSRPVGTVPPQAPANESHPLPAASASSVPSAAAAAATAPVPPRDPRRTGCRDVTEYQTLERIGEGTYGVVTRARDPRSGALVALKKIRLTGETEGFPAWAVREITALQALKHPNVVALHEVVTSRPSEYGASHANRGLGDVFLVFEYVETDMAGLLRCARQGNTGFAMTEERVRSYMFQLLTGLAHMHAMGWVHRDLKTANLLVTAGNVVKIADFGLAKPMEHGREMTPRVVTLWYRAPELLYQDRSAGMPVDVWSAGCIFGELLSGKELFVGQTEMEQAAAIYKLCGCPDGASWPGVAQLPAYMPFRPKQKFTPQWHNRFPNLPADALDLLQKLLAMNPRQRITAAEALRHPFFTSAAAPVPPPETLPPITLATGHELEVRNAAKPHGHGLTSAAGGGGGGKQSLVPPHQPTAAAAAAAAPLSRKRKLSMDATSSSAAAASDLTASSSSGAGAAPEAKRRAIDDESAAAAGAAVSAVSSSHRSDSVSSARSGSASTHASASLSRPQAAAAAAASSGVVPPPAVQSVLSRIGRGGLPGLGSVGIGGIGALSGLSGLGLGRGGALGGLSLPRLPPLAGGAAGGVAASSAISGLMRAPSISSGSIGLGGAGLRPAVGAASTAATATVATSGSDVSSSSAAAAAGDGGSGQEDDSLFLPGGGGRKSLAAHAAGLIRGGTTSVRLPAPSPPR